MSTAQPAASSSSSHAPPAGCRHDTALASVPAPSHPHCLRQVELKQKRCSALLSALLDGCNTMPVCTSSTAAAKVGHRCCCPPARTCGQAQQRDAQALLQQRQDRGRPEHGLVVGVGGDQQRAVGQVGIVHGWRVGRREGAGVVAAAAAAAEAAAGGQCSAAQPLPTCL